VKDVDDVTEPPAPAVQDADVLELASTLRLAITRTARRLRRHADAGISPSLQSALATVEAMGPVALGDLAAAEAIRPSSTTRIVARLEEEGLIVREVDPLDRRVSRVRVTPRGRRLLERTRSRKTAYLARRLRALSEPERETLARAAAILTRLVEDER
jgi:DNA-binding MarR family transcriptional regulator